jgi:hypothetical protein
MNLFLGILLGIAFIYIVWLKVQLHISQSVVKSIQANTVVLQSTKSKSSGDLRGWVVAFGLLISFALLGINAILK